MRNTKKKYNKKSDVSFFVMLGLCVVAICIVAYVTVFSDLIPNTDSPTPSLFTPSKTKLSVIDIVTNEDIPVIVPPTTEEPATLDPIVKVSYAYPIIGDITKAFVVDSVVFSPSLQDWRTHRGIDIMCEIGSPVKASAKGICEDVYEDKLMGTTVVILHEDGMRTVCANLAEDVFVSAGDKIKEDEVIAKVANTSSAECLDVPHLHFEIIQNGKQVDPEIYLE